SIARIIWVLAAAICAFTVENVWIDSWVQTRSRHRLPSLLPESLGGVWFLILLGLAISVILLVVCQVLLMRDTRISKKRKWLAGVAVLAAAVLAGNWAAATSGTTLNRRSGAGDSGDPVHSVVLRWQASAAKCAGYNVYRGTSPGAHPEKLNSARIDATTF